MTLLKYNADRRKDVQRGRQFMLEHVHAARLVIAGLIALGAGISNLSVGLAVYGVQSTMAGLHEAGRCTLNAAQSQPKDAANVAPSTSLAGTQALSA